MALVDFMAVQLKAHQLREIKAGEEMEIRVGGGTLYIARPKEGADSDKSQAIRDDKGFPSFSDNEKPLSLPIRQALIKVMPGLWAYVGTKGLKEDGVFALNDDGERSELTGNETLAQKVREWSGNEPVCLYVYSVPFGCWRFGLVAVKSPRYAAPVVLGFRPDREAVAPQNGAELSLVVAAADEVLLKLEGSPFMNKAELAPLRELVELAKRQ